VSAKSTSRRRPGVPRARAATPAQGRAGAHETWLLAALAACLALRAAASLSASSWLWGLNTFRDWPLPWPVVLPALAAVAFVPAVARAGARPLARLGDALARGGAVARGLLATAVAVALFLLRDPIRFTGDSSSRVSLISWGADLRALMPQISPLDLLVNVNGARWLMRAGLPVDTAIQAIGALTGAVLTLAMLAFLRAAGARGAAWSAAVALLLGGGSLVHLAGYEKYGLLLIGLTLAATGAVRLAREGGGAWMLAGGLVLALLAHRSAYAVMPAGLWAFATAWRAAPRERRAGLAGAAAAATAAALALLPHTAGVLVHYDLGVNIIGSATAGRVELARQLANIVNALFLLSPLWPVGAAALWSLRRRATGDPRGGLPLAGVAGLAVAGELAVMIVTRGKQGPLRDWDNQVGPALVVTLVTAYALVALWRRSGMARSALPVCATALVMGVALWGIHVGAGIGERRVATLLTDPAAWNTEEWAQAHDFIGQRAFNAGRYEEAARAYGIAAARAPSPRMLDNVAVALSMAGRDEEARDALARAMTVPQSSAAMWVALARAAETLGDSARAALCMDSARALLARGTGARGPRQAGGGPAHSP